MDQFVNQIAEQFQLPLQSPVLIFGLILCIILLIPIIFERIRTPDIIGLIICGIVVGPHGFNILEQNLFVDVFSTVGLMYIMFLAGLEINLIEFKFNRNKSLVFASLTFCLPFAIGIPVCHYLLGFDLYATLLVASIFATHTLVTYPIVGKYGISNDPSVAIAVGGTIMTDSAVLVVLAVILGASDGELSTAFWVQLLVSLVLFSLFMFVAVPRLAKWFFHHMEKSQGAHYIFVMAIVFLSGFLAEVAGLEAIIGAFAAGLALNRFIPSSSALMNRTAFIGNSLFIPFFLISVGMLVDIKVVTSGFSALLVAGSLIVVAFAGKYLAALATQHVFHLSGAQGSLLFGLSSAHAAATLAVVLVGYRADIVSDEIINAVVMVILVSCVLASFITESAARKLADATDTGGSEGAESPSEAVDRELEMERILIPLSSMDRAENLLYLATLIKDRESVHPLAVLNVVPNSEASEQRVLAVKKALEEVRKQASGADVEVDVLATIDHSVTQGITRIAREVAADIILANSPTRSSTLYGLVSGSNPDSILHQTDKALFICNLQHPVAEHTGLFVLLAPALEQAPDFELLLAKLARLATELSAPVKLYASQRTGAAVTRYIEEHELALDLKLHEMVDWQDFLVIFRKLDDLDLIVTAFAREQPHSQASLPADIPLRLERHFPEISKMLVYL